MAVPIIRVGGVPEHFNEPWHMAIEDGLFAAQGVKVEWVVIKEGTGAMLSALEAGSVDMIVALTEGLVGAIAGGKDVTLLSTYVETPLCWAISVGAKAPYNTIEDLRGETFAISRYKSGSHLMAYVLAMQRGWDPSRDISFKPTGNFTNLRNALNDPENPSAAFMWETFTTKPFHDSGEIRRVGDISTPWPCFMIAAKASKANDPANIKAYSSVLKAIRQSCEQFGSQRDVMPAVVARKYKLQLEDAEAWYKNVRVTASPTISKHGVKEALEALRKVGVLPTPGQGEDDPFADEKAFICPHYATLGEEDIKSHMELYDKPSLVQLIVSELKEHGKATGPLAYTDILPLDHHHYHLLPFDRDANAPVCDMPALDTCADLLSLKVIKPSGANTPTPLTQCRTCGNLGRDTAKFCDQCGKALGLPADPVRVINYGSGLGGPARYLAGKYGCDVLAIEIQEELHAVGAELTRRCQASLAGSVHHLGGDVMDFSTMLRTDHYDAVVSWLMMLHVEDRPRLLRQTRSLLKPGGYFFAEDFFKRGQEEFTADEQTYLRDQVFVKKCLTQAEYTAELEQAGFQVVRFIDVSQAWTQYTAERSKCFDRDAERNTRVLGQETYARLSAFYKRIAEIYADGRLGGCRVLARKK